MDPEAETEAGVCFRILYCATGEGQVEVESVKPVAEMEGGNRRVEIDFCRWWN